MHVMLNRMCWNSRGWLLPTASSRDGGYPAKMGFGHEEWNFQTADAVDGYVYGYLYYTPSVARLKESGNEFKIFFWSKHPETGQHFVVGSYLSASIPTQEDYERVDKAFQARAVYERRVSELRSAVPSLTEAEAYSEVRGAVNNQYLKFKCREELVHHFAEYIPVNEFLPSRQIGWYFATPTFIGENEIALPEMSKGRAPSRRTTSRRIAALAEDAYFRETPANLKEITRQHNRLSNKFAAWLRHSGFEQVQQEENFVDVFFKRQDRSFRAELKTCYGAPTTKAIREALGQLLEYNFYPGRIPAESWAIILDSEPSLDDISFVTTLTSSCGLPLSLGWLHGEGFRFAGGLELS